MEVVLSWSTLRKSQSAYVAEASTALVGPMLALYVAYTGQPFSGVAAMRTSATLCTHCVIIIIILESTHCTRAHIVLCSVAVAAAYVDPC